MSSDKKNASTGLAFNVGDTVIVKIDDKKYASVFVHRKTDRHCSGTVTKYAPYDEVVLEFLRDQVVCNLGTDPAPGNLYGQQIEPFFRTAVSSAGSVHFFYRVSKKEKDSLIDTLNKVYDKMKTKGLRDIFPLTIECRPVKGNTYGSYKVGKKGDNDVMCLRPSIECDLNHVVFHELGHPVWKHLFTETTRAKWIRAYHKQVKVSRLTARDSRSLLKKVMADRLVLKDFAANLEDDSKIVLKEIVKHIKKVHGLSPRDIDTMILADEDITEFWPTTDMEVSEIRSDVSDYSKKSPEEFFSEIFSFYMIRKDIPERVKKLLEKSLEAVAGKKVMRSDTDDANGTDSHTTSDET